MKAKQKNTGRRGKKEKYQITSPDGFKYKAIVGIGLRKEMEKEGFDFEVLE